MNYSKFKKDDLITALNAVENIVITMEDNASIAEELPDDLTMTRDQAVQLHRGWAKRLRDAINPTEA